MTNIIDTKIFVRDKIYPIKLNSKLNLFLFIVHGTSGFNYFINSNAISGKLNIIWFTCEVNIFYICNDEK